MRFRVFVFFLLSVSAASFLAFALESAQKRSPASEISPRPFASVVPEDELPDDLAGASPVPTPEEKLDAKTIRKIRREFRRRLDRERSALKAEQKRLKKERDAQRDERRRTWYEAEKAARRKFFAENPGAGAKKREYMHAHNERRVNFDAQLKEEKKREREEREIRWKALEQDQRDRWSAVEESLRQGKRPDERLLQPTVLSR